MEIYPPGSRIGQYEVVSKPMMGGMGVVYFALDHGNDDHPVALKTFRPEFLPDREARDRFLREGTAWVDLGSHPHIVRCHRVNYIDPTVFLSLELIAKEQGMEDASLRSWMGSPMNVEQALLFALQIARGMHHATAQIPGFVHRDLKPENVLVGADKLPGTKVNRLRVTDFGLATMLKDENGRLIDEDGAMGRTHLTHGIVGTPFYMAPEQWKGEVVGVYTDVYALGCILYEMVSGEHAIKGSNLGQLKEMHCLGKKQPFPISLSNDILSLISKCLALKPHDRYENWSEVIEEIEQIYLQQTRVSAPRIGDSVELKFEERIQEGWSYNAIGEAYKHIGKAEISVRYCERALSIARETGNRNGEGIALGNLGNAYAALGDTHQAVDYYNQCLIITREIGEREGEGVTLANLGTSFRDLGDAHRAIDYFKQALDIKREMNDQESEANTLNNLGIAYNNLGDARQAIRYFVQSLEIARRIGDRRDEASALGNLGTAYNKLGDKHQAILYLEQQLVISREIGDRRSEGIALGNLGNVNGDLGHSRKALDYYEQSLIISREIGDQRGVGIALTNLGSVYADLKDARLAINYHEQALVIQREIGDRRSEGAVLSNLGATYGELGDIPQAVEYLEQALDIQQEIGDLNAVAFTSLNLAVLYIQKGDFIRAMALAKEAARIFAQIGSPNAEVAQQLIDQLGGDSLPLQQSDPYPAANVPIAQQQVDQLETDPYQDAFVAFQITNSYDDMLVVVGRFPFMTSDEYIVGVEQTLEHNVPLMFRSRLIERLKWLKQIAKKQKPGFLGRMFGKK